MWHAHVLHHVGSRLRPAVGPTSRGSDRRGPITGASECSIMVLREGRHLLQSLFEASCRKYFLHCRQQMNPIKGVGLQRPGVGATGCSAVVLARLNFRAASSACNANSVGHLNHSPRMRYGCNRTLVAASMWRARLSVFVSMILRIERVSGESFVKPAMRLRTSRDMPTLISPSDRLNR
jgi:hypothetical protein